MFILDLVSFRVWKEWVGTSILKNTSNKSHQIEVVNQIKYSHTQAIAQS